MSGDADIPSSSSSSASTINHSHDNTSTTSNTTSSTDQTTRETTPPRTTSQGTNKDPSTRSPSSSSPTSTTSPHSSPSQHSSNQPPSRRVKVYKLKDDAWVDLGTGTCQGVLIQQNSPPGDMEVDLSEQKKEKLDPAEEGAWIVVKREKVKKEAGATGGSSDDEGDNEGEDDEDDDQDEKNVILKTRVQPYPPGYSEDFDEEELVEGEDGQTLDVGGYQRQQDTLIVWTERGDGDEEMEMALSFATSTGCAEMWEFIKAARRFTGEERNYDSISSRRKADLALYFTQLNKLYCHLHLHPLLLPLELFPCTPISLPSRPNFQLPRSVRFLN